MQTTMLNTVASPVIAMRTLAASRPAAPLVQRRNVVLHASGSGDHPVSSQNKSNHVFLDGHRMFAQHPSSAGAFPSSLIMKMFMDFLVVIARKYHLSAAS